MARRPFTPQRSPSQPASNASSASSHSGEDDHEQRGQSQQGMGPDKGIVEGQSNRSATDATDQTSSANQFASSSSAPFSWNALRGWTAHQSHGQATILFYVPRWTRSDSLDVLIGHDYIIAGIQGQEPVVKARLAGRINPTTSAWQLEKRSSKRHRSRSRTRTRMRTRSSDQSSSGSGANSGNVKVAEADQVSRAARSRQTSQRSSGVNLGPAAKPASRTPQRPRSRQPSRPISPVHSDASSFDMLARSTETLGSTSSAASPWLSQEGEGSPSDGSRHVSPSEGHSSPAISSPHSLSQSVTLSEGSGYLHSINQAPGSGSNSGGVRSMESSVSIEPSHASSGSRQRAQGEESDDANDPTRDAKLVTLHLDKIDGGIWPCIVSGPAPTQSTAQQEQQSLAQLISNRSQFSLNAALSDALRHRHPKRNRSASEDRQSDTSGSHDGHQIEMESEGGGDSVNESTATIDTIGSDDSTTVLGVRQQQDEELYNMDPISLTLLGMQHARRSTTIPFGSASARDDIHAFECFRRAWREAEVPAATDRLVHDYLPLHASSNIMAPYRQRLTAALGGPTAVARLYISYAQLHLPSYGYRKPLLALPMSGASNNPFGAYSALQEAHHSHTSPRLGAGTSEPDMPPGPMQYLCEARKLDPNISIPETDWQEADAIDQERTALASRRRGPGSAWSGAASPTSKSEGLFESDASGPSGGRHGQQARRSKRRKAGSRRDKLGGPSSTDQGLIFLVVSRAALLSVMVAGGMAVAGWWRRAAAAGSG